MVNVQIIMIYSNIYIYIFGKHGAIKEILELYAILWNLMRQLCSNDRNVFG